MVLIAGTVGVIMSVPGQTMGVSVFTDDLMKGLHLTRVQLSVAYMLGTLASSFLLPMVGRLLDRVGARIMSVIAAGGLAISLALMAAGPGIARFLTRFSHFRPAWVSLLVLVVLFLGIRHFGQGQLTMTSRTMIGKWFEKRRGRVLGISGFFVAFAFGVSPLVLTRMIHHFGWQGCLLVLAGGSIGMAILGALFFRPTPELCGLHVEGGPLDEPIDSPDSDSPDITPAIAQHAYTAQEAKRTLTFWLFNLGFTAQALLGTAMTFHMARIGALHGLHGAEAFRIFLPIAVISTISELSSGFISDRVPLQYLLVVMEAGQFLGVLCLNYIGTSAGFWLTALGFGISSGLYSLLAGAAWPKLFGRKHLGAIAGASAAWMVAGSAIGPYLFSLANAWTGHFTAAFHWSLLIPGTLVIAAFWAKAPVSTPVR